MQRYVFMFFYCVLVVCGSAQAVELYQWKDAAGVLHFTDNELNVPALQRQSAKREVNALRAYSGSEGSQPQAVGMAEKVWMLKCASCHTTGLGENEKIGLGKLAVNQSTKFPETIENLWPKLRWAADGRWSDMPKQDVSDDELKQIAAFLLGVK
ncbi:MAG: DUF4124 domain-containing protein [Mariprofundaceae bacterium]